MIDFRYHLVSLVSVFMALAIGVVLGAGPLRDSIGDQLSNQVEGLLRDKSDLQQAVENRDQLIADRDTFIDSVGGTLTASQLGGRSVVVVTLPGADSDVVDALTESLQSAGAEVTGQVRVTPRWTDPEQAAFRESLAGQLVPYLQAAPEASASLDSQLGALLAEAVLSPELAGQGQATPEAQTVLDALSGGDLVSTDGEPQSGGTLAVVVTGAPQDAAGVEDADWTEAASTSYLTLLSALDSGSAGVVVVGPVSATTDDGLLDRLRADETLSGRVSSVDSADSPMGRITTVLALREEMLGSSGQYGYGDGASAPVPTDTSAGTDVPAPDGGAPTGAETDG